MIAGWMASLRARLGRAGARVDPANQARFEEVWRAGLWGSKESASGPGSERSAGSVTHSVEVLDRLIGDLGVRSLADIPCGDFNWMPLLLERRPGLSYRGYDVVEALIADNRRRFPGMRFELLDITRSPPARVDLIFSKDLMNHLPEAQVWAALENMVASGSRWLLLTTNRGFANTELQEGVPHASRHLDLENAPYSLREPLWGDHYLLLFTREQVARRLDARRA